MILIDDEGREVFNTAIGVNPVYGPACGVKTVAPNHGRIVGKLGWSIGDLSEKPDPQHPK